MSSTCHENGADYGFFGPVRFRGHFEEIGIAKVEMKVVYNGVLCSGV